MRLLVLGLGLASLLLVPLASSAAVISQFSYSITGGTSTTPLFGPLVITGGTINLHPVTPVQTSFSSTFAGPAFWSGTLITTGAAEFQLGFSGGMTVYFVNPTFLIVDLKTVTAYGTIAGFPFTATAQTAKSALFFDGASGVFTLGGSMAQASTSTTITGPWTITLLLGSEVRTVVPEPASAGLLGLGLLGLGIVGGGRRAVVRKRRTNRP